MICTFFGHKDTPENIQPLLRTVIIDLIQNKNVDLFYVGNNGNFDFMVKNTLKFLKLTYPHIKYAVVLSYMPNPKNGSGDIDYSDTIYPEELENISPKYAIVKRNQWMIKQSDYVITYVKYTAGGALRFKELAEKQKKTVLNLADLDQSKI